MDFLRGFGNLLQTASRSPQVVDESSKAQLLYFLDLLERQHSGSCIAHLLVWLRVTESEFNDWWVSNKIYKAIALITHPDKQNEFAKAPGLFIKLQDMHDYIKSRQSTPPPQSPWTTSCNNNATPQAASNNTNAPQQAPSWPGKWTVEIRAKFKEAGWQLDLDKVIRDCQGPANDGWPMRGRAWCEDCWSGKPVSAAAPAPAAPTAAPAPAAPAAAPAPAAPFGVLVPPRDIPDQCEYWPVSVQTDYFAAGWPLTAQLIGSKNLLPANDGWSMTCQKCKNRNQLCCKQSRWGAKLCWTCFQLTMAHS